MLPMAFHDSIAAGGVGVLRCARKEYGGKSAGSHGCETMVATWYFLYIAAETEHIEGRKLACVF